MGNERYYNTGRSRNHQEVSDSEDNDRLGNYHDMQNALDDLSDNYDNNQTRNHASNSDNQQGHIELLYNQWIDGYRFPGPIICIRRPNSSVPNRPCIVRGVTIHEPNDSYDEAENSNDYEDDNSYDDYDRH